MFPSRYKTLEQASWNEGRYSIVPIRYEDRLAIMQWRNEQLYHLRQQQPLTAAGQERYFTEVVAHLFDQERPVQLLFSYLEDGRCIGYGGLVHMNWVDRHAEISFILDTQREQQEFQLHWQTWLKLIEQVAFDGLQLRKIFTYAYDLRPHLFEAIEAAGYECEAVLKAHCLFDGNYIDVLIHSKQHPLRLRRATMADAQLLFDWANDPEERRNSLNPQQIVWEQHVLWLEEKLASDRHKFYILESGGCPVGKLRLDRDGNQWIINYSIAAEHRGNGFGKRILELLLLQLPGASFRAVVKQANAASLRIFDALSFRRSEESNDLITFIR